MKPFSTASTASVLVADVVTGKIHVRAAAAELPEIEEVEPIEGGDEEDEGLDEPTDADMEREAA